MEKNNPSEVLTRMRREAVFRLFDKKFKAKTRITVGSATCENAAGADEVFRKFKELVESSGRTDIALSRVGCAGKCDMEPMVTVISRGEIPTKYVLMDPERSEKVFDNHIIKGQIVKEYSMRHLTGGGEEERVVCFCGGANCPRGKASDIEKAFKEETELLGLSKKVAFTQSSCRGFCDDGPVAFIYPEGIGYKALTAEAARRIVRQHLKDGKPVNEYAYESERISNRFFPFFGDVEYFSKQLRLTLRNCGLIDPESLDEYLAVRGYEAAAVALEKMSPQDVVAAVLKSGLRGRGGGGYPTGIKWGNGAKGPGKDKYIICNADEGDPGAFMDRSTIEGDPHSVIEGMLIGSYAIGAHSGYIYIRAEYPLAIERLEIAIDEARRAGFLGKNILGSGWDFDIELRLGAGAFVCGEETALIHSIEGKRGMPRPRPPYPSFSGLWGCPTVINNVETLATIPVVILDGPEWFSAIGTEKSKGTKVFALAGDVENTGLVEVPMGSTLRDVVYGIGGGIKNGRRLKAVQTGGPAGGCLPESALDTPIDYESLAKAGSIMGSGGMIVMDDKACMVNVAKFFIEFTQDESCGKCTPCREGTKRMLEILTRICEGKGKEGDVEKLLRLCETIKRTSLCGLGQAAPNPVLSTITHFRDEYNAHIRDKHCPTGVCKALLVYKIIPEKCVGCGACKRSCPVACITGEVRKLHLIDQDQCIRCGRCFEVCKFEAVARG